MKSKLYTRTGDNGTTSLVGGTRTPKDSPRLEAYGTVDELNSWIGLIASANVISESRRTVLHCIQNRLFDIGAALATEPESTWQPSPPSEKSIKIIEDAIDEIDSTLPPIRQFVLPGGHPVAAQINIARSVARRAERRVITLQNSVEIAPEIVRYINRLSDFLFALGREVNINTSNSEIFWQKDC